MAAVIKQAFVWILIEALLFNTLAHAQQARGGPLAFSPPPQITHTPIGPSVAQGTDVEIHATVTDDTGVTNVTLHFRPQGGKTFQTQPMTRTSAGDYAANLPGASVQAPGLEYTISAEDTDGNTVFSRSLSSPYAITVFKPVDKPAEVAGAGLPTMGKPDTAKPEAEESSGVSTWVWVALGVLALGAAAGGGGGGGSGGGTSTLGSAGTSTVTVTAPTP